MLYTTTLKKNAKWQSSNSKMRSTQSRQHGYLPAPSTCHREFESLIRDMNKVRVGFQFLYGYNHNYKVEKGNIILSQQRPMRNIECLHENQRTCHMMTGLMSVLGDEYKIFCSAKESRHYCPFSGGGDI